MNIDELTNLKARYEKLIGLKNKDFAFECILILIDLNINECDVEMLCCTSKLKNRFTKSSAFVFPILKEYIDGKEYSKNFYVKNRQRYYNRIFTIHSKQYVVCNDWYYNNKISTKDNRTEFIKYIKTLIDFRFVAE